MTRYRKAVDQGWPPAQAALAMLHARGGAAGSSGEEEWRGVGAAASADSLHNRGGGTLAGAALGLEEALMWYRAAAERGEVHAQAQLGSCLRHRHGAAPIAAAADAAAAAAAAAPRSSPSGSPSTSSSGSLLGSRRRSPSAPSEALRDVASALEAARWLETAAGRGHAGAAATLAVLYLEGRLPKVAAG
jgi:TPR repeat protein